MGFESLLGNERLKENLRGSIAKDRISHFYLISGPKGSGKHTLARLLAAAILCQSRENKPCGQCAACRKVMADTHPDLITVDDPEKKTVPVDLIRKARADIYVQPNEAEYKLYLFPRAQDMGLPGQNALLKVLEEPPSYGVFLLLTDNPEKLLPTVRSRCTELPLTALPEKLLLGELARRFPKAEPQALRGAAQRCGGYLGQGIRILEEGESIPPQTEAFVKAFSARDALGLMQLLVPMEKWKRDQLLTILQQWLELLENALACRAGITAMSALAESLSSSRSSPDLMDAVRHLQKSIEYVQSNVSPAAVCAYLAWSLR